MCQRSGCKTSACRSQSHEQSLPKRWTWSHVTTQSVHSKPPVVMCKSWMNRSNFDSSSLLTPTAKMRRGNVSLLCDAYSNCISINIWNQSLHLALEEKQRLWFLVSSQLPLSVSDVSEQIAQLLQERLEFAQKHSVHFILMLKVNSNVAQFAFILHVWLDLLCGS